MIRTALADDAASIAHLSTAIGYPNSAEDILPILLRILDDKAHVVLVFEVSGSVVGWVHAAEQLNLESGPRCEILGLAVDPDSRRLGIGSQLVHAAEMWAKRQGFPRIGVKSNATRLESHPFYKQVGFVHVKTQHVYRKILDADRDRER